MTVFERIKKLSNKNKISLLQLNDRAGLGKNAIYKWKTQNPSTENLRKVANVLGVSVDYLLDNTNDNSTSVEPKKVDLADDNYIMTYQGKPIPPEDMEYIKRILNGGKD